MNSLEIERLIITHMADWDYFNPQKIARSNVNFKPPKTGIWYRFSVLGGVNLIHSINDKPCVLQQGTVIVQLFAPHGTGTGELKTQADSLAEHLGCYKADKLELLAPSVLDMGDDNHGYYQINVSIPYRYC